MNKVILGDCLEKLKELEDNSVDSICCDPPYELGFMGKSWDNTGIANNPLMWKECLRVLKPGGHLLAFSGTRTYHRMASAIEDAGFEVRDMIEWCYGSGFPKSLNIGKAVDKLQGNERENLGERSGAVNPNGYKTDGNTQSGGAFKAGKFTETKGTSEWEGWGTALKPAHEPICLARKPLAEKTVAENVRKYGTGGINIDESRVEVEPNDVNHRNPLNSKSYGTTFGSDTKIESNQIQRLVTGRFPANLIHDNSEEVRECFPDTKSGYNPKAPSKQYGGGSFGGGLVPGEGISGYGDEGNASRFFKSIIYQAKASKSERNKGMDDLEAKPMYKADGSAQSLEIFGSTDGGREDRKNNHPTVKPIALMEYLIKMVTPKGGIVLDPFAGSGSTLVAAKQNGYQYIGIEMTEEYIPIIEARLKADVVVGENLIDLLG